MCRLYEKFILEYFRRVHPEIMANACQIPWQLDDDMNAILPVMQTESSCDTGGLLIDLFPCTCVYNLKYIVDRFPRTDNSTKTAIDMFPYTENQQNTYPTSI